jgi:quinol monooxygenase YgiN
MREQVIVSFEVKEKSVENAKVAIKEFIENIRAKEAGTLYYTSLQDQQNPNQFIHFMIFADKESHQHHRQTEYVNEFVNKLYPLCEKEPQPVFLEEFDSCGVAATALVLTKEK